MKLSDRFSGSSRSMADAPPSRRCSSKYEEVYLSRRDRESTDPPEEYEDDANKNTLPCIELRFSDPPRTSAGLVFGTDPTTSDVILPGLKGISRRHFALTYKIKFDDGRDRLIVRDLGSTYGTIVKYDGKGDRLRSKFDWIIGGGGLNSLMTPKRLLCSHMRN